MPYKPDGSPPPRAYHHEEQGSMAEHHPGGGVHPHGSVDCFGNYELLKPDGKLKIDS